MYLAIPITVGETLAPVHAPVLRKTELVACSSAPGWPIVYFEFSAEPSCRANQVDEGMLCKSRLSVRNAINRRANASVRAIAATATA